MYCNTIDWYMKVVNWNKLLQNKWINKVHLLYCRCTGDCLIWYFAYFSTNHSTALQSQLSGLSCDKLKNEQKFWQFCRTAVRWRNGKNVVRCFTYVIQFVFTNSKCRSADWWEGKIPRNTFFPTYQVFLISIFFIANSCLEYDTWNTIRTLKFKHHIIG